MFIRFAAKEDSNLDSAGGTSGYDFEIATEASRRSVRPRGWGQMYSTTRDCTSSTTQTGTTRSASSCISGAAGPGTNWWKGCPLRRVCAGTSTVVIVAG